MAPNTVTEHQSAVRAIRQARHSGHPHRVDRHPTRSAFPTSPDRAGDAAKGVLAAEPYTFDVTVTSEPNATIAGQHRAAHRPGGQHTGRQGVEDQPHRVRRPGQGQGATGRGPHRSCRSQSVDDQGSRAPTSCTRPWPPARPQDGIVISQSIPSTEIGAAGYDDPPAGRQGRTGTDHHHHDDHDPTDDDVDHAAAAIRRLVDRTDHAHHGGQGSVTFKITVTNNGPNGVTPATFTDTISGGPAVSRGPAHSSGSANCPPLSDPHNGNINTQVDLPMGGSVVFNVTVTSGTNLTNHGNDHQQRVRPELGQQHAGRRSGLGRLTDARQRGSYRKLRSRS